MIRAKVITGRRSSSTGTDSDAACTRDEMSPRKWKEVERIIESLPTFDADDPSICPWCLQTACGVGCNRPIAL